MVRRKLKQKNKEKKKTLRGSLVGLRYYGEIGRQFEFPPGRWRFYSTINFKA